MRTPGGELNAFGDLGAATCDPLVSGYAVAWEANGPDRGRDHYKPK